MSSHDDANLPPLYSDRGFWGLNLTQFLGAFNDNLFKQLVLLICVDRTNRGGQDLQGLAMVLFAWPFIAFSGYAGFLSDRFSKRTIIVLCKLAEFLIVLLGLIGFCSGDLTILLSVLCLMGVHSAFFGPSKYGILPEMLRAGDLPRANGMMLMATFLAIIFGLSAAGAAKQAFEKTLWIASLPCLIIALVGLATSLLLRPTPVANPHLKFAWSSVGIAPETRRLLATNRTLLGVLLMSSVFWFVGGTVYPPAINAFCKDQLLVNDLTTGAMAASTGLGIAIGCVTAGILSKNRVQGWLVRLGAWGLTLSLAALCIPGPGFSTVREEIQRSNRIARSLAHRVSFHEHQIPVRDLFHRIEREHGIPVSIEPAGFLADDARVTLDLDQVPLKQALDAVCRDISARFTIVCGSLVISSTSDSQQTIESLKARHRSEQARRGSLLGPLGSVAALIAVGLFAGFFSVPLQVFLQATTPLDQKGRIIGTLNLFNWVGIAGSGAIYWVGRQLLVGWLEMPHAALFGFAGLLMLPVALFYRPPDVVIGSSIDLDGPGTTR